MKRILLLATVSAFALALVPSAAFAHPAYKSSSPAADSSVAEPPSEIWVEFTERIEGGSITVTDPCGEQADHGDEEMNLTQDRLTTAAHGDKAGTYTVDWSVLGSDGHNTRGSFVFEATGGSSCPGTEEPKDPDKTDDPKPPRERKPIQSDADNSGDPSADSSPGRGGSDRSKKAGDHSRHSKGGSKNADSVKGTRQSRLDLAQSPETPAPTGDRSIWDGIPVGDFMIALGVAALIGAAGGRIYAGIVGPRR